MRRSFVKKLTIPLILVLSSVLVSSYLVTQETRDFKIVKSLDIFFSLFRELNTFYVDEIDPEKVMKTGIDNMLRSLDPYTVYYPESDADDFSFMTTGQYGGIGSLIRTSGEYAVISEVYRNYPADKSGIKAGDIIKKVNGESLRGASSDKVSDRLKGSPGSEIILTIERSGLEMDFTMKREKIAIPPVPFSGMIDNTTGYIRFTNFTQNCIEDVKEALLKLRENNPEQIILDLRGNPGGLLTEAVEIVNLFVGPGNEVVSTKGKVRQFDEVFKTTREAIDEKIPLAVLINRGSASAAEIVAGAIQDLDRGIIVGQRSYGKGLVQVTRPLSYSTQLKITTAKYYIPSGRCIQALDFSHPNEDGSVGIIPDSLISEFKTRNGRTVKDGGGIMPDIEINPQQLSQVTTELFIRNYIFDFATEYYWKNQQIKPIEEIRVTDEVYNDFKNFLSRKSFNYSSITERSLAELIENAKREKYFDDHKDKFIALQQEIGHDLNNDLENFREEISELLEDELITRYYYEEGAISRSVSKDEQIIRAVEILKNRDKYTSILSGKESSIIMAGRSHSPGSRIKEIIRNGEASI